MFIKYVLIGRNKTNTMFEVKKHFNLLGLYIPFKKSKNISVLLIIDAIKNGRKYYTLFENSKSVIDTYKNKNNTYLRSDGNGENADNINQLPVTIF